MMSGYLVSGIHLSILDFFGEIKAVKVPRSEDLHSSSLLLESLEKRFAHAGQHFGIEKQKILGVKIKLKPLSKSTSSNCIKTSSSKT